jgi:tetratricopeptide (TPR) repeat protein
MLLAGIAVVAACSSPAVTGMKVHIQNGEYEEAIHVADSVIAAGSATAEVYMWRGQALSTLQRWEEAAESYAMAYEMDPTYASDIAVEWFVFYNAAGGKLADGEVEEALEMVETGKQVAPARPEFDQMLGDLALQEGNRQEALDHFQAAWELSQPLLEDYRTKMEEAADERQQAYFADMIENTRESAVLSLYNIGMVRKAMALEAEDEAVRQENLEKAQDALSEALEMQPSNSDVLNGLADIMILRGQFDEALAIFDEAMDIIDQQVADGMMTEDEGSALKADLRVKKGLTLIEMEEFDQALAQLETVLEGEYGGDYSILASVAHAYFQMERYEDALSKLQEAVAISGVTPEQLAQGYFMQYAAYTRLENDEAAAQALETALQYDQDNAQYWEYLASTYSRLGRRSDAIEAMEKAEEYGGGE